jgi:hypothetical protein
VTSLLPASACYRMSTLDGKPSASTSMVLEGDYCSNLAPDHRKASGLASSATHGLTCSMQSFAAASFPATYCLLIPDVSRQPSRKTRSGMKFNPIPARFGRSDRTLRLVFKSHSGVTPLGCVLRTLSEALRSWPFYFTSVALTPSRGILLAGCGVMSNRS